MHIPFPQVLDLSKETWLIIGKNALQIPEFAHFMYLKQEEICIPVDSTGTEYNRENDDNSDSGDESESIERSFKKLWAFRSERFLCHRCCSFATNIMTLPALKIDISTTLGLSLISFVIFCSWICGAVFSSV
jgi:hypothetical protein